MLGLGDTTSCTPETPIAPRGVKVFPGERMGVGQPSCNRPMDARGDVGTWLEALGPKEGGATTGAGPAAVNVVATGTGVLAALRGKLMSLCLVHALHTVRVVDGGESTGTKALLPSRGIRSPYTGSAVAPPASFGSNGAAAAADELWQDVIRGVDSAGVDIAGVDTAGMVMGNKMLMPPISKVLGGGVPG
mmetsp:Transcript_26018/g.55062  ORF Transcript_26018/g.55062 Transcript_26018/m.55062 type:complete len:190 (-) Transcript_26018:1339-1908(-)